MAEEKSKSKNKEVKIVETNKVVDAVIVPEVKQEEKKEVEKTSVETKTDVAPKRKGRFVFKFILFLLFCLILVGCGVGVGAYSYPKAKDWLINHGFIKIDEAGSTKIDLSSTGTTKIVSENDAIINVVKESHDAVVSIAIANTQGGISSTSNIGSGFIVDPSGIVITNQHVVSNATTSYKVVTTDGTEYAVKQIATDDYNDIAILKIEANNLPALKFGDSDSLQLGESVIAIGTPLGEFAGSVTTGVISGLNRSVSAGQSGFWGVAKVYENVIQTDAAVNSGNSGGPLLNLKGEVVGINFATTSGADNISFALPINVMKSKLDEFRTYGKLLKPYLGVQYQMVSEAEASLYKNLVSGAMISRVSIDSPAAKADIRNGDIITEFGGEKVNVSLSMLIQKYKVGEEIEVKLHRGDQDLTVKVKLVEAQ